MREIALPSFELLVEPSIGRLCLCWVDTVVLVLCKTAAIQFHCCWLF